ncbi:MAG: hypothetical protein ACRCSF_12055 [Mycobacteriaceae bacterium]
MVVELVFGLMILSVLLLSLYRWRSGTATAKSGSVTEKLFGLRNREAGTLLILGASPRPETPGNQYVTITGTLSGPTVSDHQIYGRFNWDSNNWPTVGSSVSVVYNSKNPSDWTVVDSNARPYFRD